MAQTPSYSLNDGVSLPAVGFGTYPLVKDEATTAVASAIETGYRLIDTAVNYMNERFVGHAIRDSGVPRDELRVATKVPGRFHRRDLALQSVRESLERMGLDYLDLVLIHWPNPSQGLYVEAFQGLLDAREQGLVTSVGVSNYTEAHLREVIASTGVTPAVNQIELHPLFPQQHMLTVHRELGIQTQSWSPLGKQQAQFEAAAVTGPATEYGVTPAQVILRWQLQRGSLPLPKSATPSRQRENLEVFDFELTDEQVAAITALGRPDGRLFGGDPQTHEEM